MRNVPCGHTYSKAGIMQSLRKKHEVRPPALPPSLSPSPLPSLPPFLPSFLPSPKACRSFPLGELVVSPFGRKLSPSTLQEKKSLENAGRLQPRAPSLPPSPPPSLTPSLLPSSCRSSAPYLGATRPFAPRPWSETGKRRYWCCASSGRRKVYVWPPRGTRERRRWRNEGWEGGREGGGGRSIVNKEARDAVRQSKASLFLLPFPPLPLVSSPTFLTHVLGFTSGPRRPLPRLSSLPYGGSSPPSPLLPPPLRLPTQFFVLLRKLDFVLPSPVPLLPFPSHASFSRHFLPRQPCPPSSTFGPQPQLLFSRIQTWNLLPLSFCKEFRNRPSKSLCQNACTRTAPPTPRREGAGGREGGRAGGREREGGRYRGGPL
jgi:hypothetical protein